MGNEKIIVVLYNSKIIKVEKLGLEIHGRWWPGKQPWLRCLCMDPDRFLFCPSNKKSFLLIFNPFSNIDRHRRQPLW
ncbi:hypothetical protein LguiA_021769 [Lonicera macranthoides]